MSFDMRRRPFLLNLVPRAFSGFLQRMFDENEGSWKDQFFGDPDWLSEM